MAYNGIDDVANDDVNEYDEQGEKVSYLIHMTVRPIARENLSSDPKPVARAQQINPLTFTFTSNNIKFLDPENPLNSNAYISYNDAFEYASREHY